MATVQRVRTHATARNLFRFNQYISKCTELDAIVSVASEVEWLHREPGRIIVADAKGSMVCKVWNAPAFDVHAASDGPFIQSPSIHRVGHYVIEAVRPLKTEVRSHFLTVEAPE